jgi:glycosyltransferase involved in cell wall biosynthesis
MDAQVPKIRLCLASPSFFPTYGGAQLRFLRYMPGLRERGIETRVVTGTPTVNEAAGSQVQEHWLSQRPGHVFPMEEINGTPVHRVRLPDSKGWRRMILFNQTLLRCCRRPETRPEVVQLVTHLLPRAIPWLLRLRIMGIPSVYAVTLAPTQAPKGPLKRLMRHASLRYLYNQLDCIIANNTPLRDMVRELGVLTRIEVIPNGVDLKRFHPAGDGQQRHAIRRSLRIGDADPVICTVGAVNPRKGGDMLLEAWGRLVARFPRSHVLFVGPQTHLEHPKLDRFRRRIEDLTHNSGAAERVHFTGTVDDVEAYLRASDVFVLPTEREGLPNSVLEAMATSLPVVITPFIGLSADLGVADRHYLLSDPNAEALATHMGRLLEDRNYRIELGRRGRRWVEETMDVRRSLDRYAALYRELAEGSLAGHK